MRDKPKAAEDKKILLGHGSGGLLTHNLISDVFLKAFTNPLLSPLNDQAVFSLPPERVAFTTDSYVVSPIFFPGGDIGKLSVCGTINDLAVGGARPLYLSASFIIEEGYSIDSIAKIARSMAKTAKEAGVMIVTGDTKVVERGKGDGVFINTAGIGVLPEALELSPSLIRAGDVVIASGTIGDHGIAIMTHREGIEMDVPVKSDCAPLHSLVEDMLSVAKGLRAMRDPTRGGVATILSEFASASGCGFLIKEEAVPVRDAVRGACELLGFDPLYLANEGKLLAVVSKKDAEKTLDVMRKNPLGRDAAIIGEAIEKPAGTVLLETSIGNRRILDMLSGEQLPRIC